jgi:hypothetical protein
MREALEQQFSEKEEDIQTRGKNEVNVIPTCKYELSRGRGTAGLTLAEKPRSYTSQRLWPPTKNKRPETLKCCP